MQTHFGCGLTMLDKKMSAFGSDVVTAMHMLEARLGAQITVEREERVKNSAETKARLDDVTTRLQKL